MKTILKIAAVAVAAVTALVVLAVFCMAGMPAVPEDYTVTTATAGPIESRYMAMGGCEVGYMESPALMSFKKYEIFYPTDAGGPLPAVIFVNGTGVAGSKYRALQRHLASWGFITVATEEEHAWNGFSAEMSVRYLELLNGYDGEIDGGPNPLFGRVDTGRIGITGHSQGGYGVVNAITGHRHAGSYRAAVILSCGHTKDVNPFQWEADDSLIAAPTLVLGSTGKADSLIAPPESLRRLYGSIPDGVAKAMAIRKDADHGQMLYFGDGYVTAWFMYHLCGDAQAAGAFLGDGAEIASNPNWCGVEKNM